MSRTRKNYPAHFKAKVALSALREDAPISELASQFGIHGTVIHRWKKEALQGMEDRFKDSTQKSQKDHASEIKELHAKIGELTVEKDFLERASKALGLGGVKK
jgi:transposase